MPFRAVLFDLDGTLWRPAPERGEDRLARLNAIRAERISVFLAERGWGHVDPLEIVRFYIRCVDEANATAVTHFGGFKAIDPGGLAEMTFTAFGLKVGERDIAAFWPLLRISYPQWPVELFPDTLATLTEVRKADLSTVLVTNNVGESVLKPELHDFGIGPHIDHLVTSMDVGHVKPGPQIFEHALRAAGVSPAEALMVGDTFALDIRGARALGIPAVLKLNGREPTPEERHESDYLINDLSDLLELGLFAIDSTTEQKTGAGVPPSAASDRESEAVSC